MVGPGEGGGKMEADSIGIACSRTLENKVWVR